MRLPISLILAALPLLAGEYAVLPGGFRIWAERIERDAKSVRLITPDGTIEVPAETVLTVEPEDYAPPPAPAESEVLPTKPPTTRELIDAAAERYGVPAEILHSIAATESGLDPSAVSPKGAIGIMQLMPGTAVELKADPREPAQNVDAGARYLRDLLVRYDGGLHRSFAAYNAGPGAVAKYGGIPPYRETVGYVEKVMERYRRLSESRKILPDNNVKRIQP